MKKCLTEKDYFGRDDVTAENCFITVNQPRKNVGFFVSARLGVGVPRIRLSQIRGAGVMTRFQHQRLFSLGEKVNQYQSSEKGVITMTNQVSTVVSNQPEIQEFKFNTNQIRVINKDGEPWFIAVDVCTVLGIQNPSDAIKKRLDDDEYALDLIYTGASSSNQAYLVNESGFYSLVLGSRKPVAKEFKRWVTHEVLPSIRKTGSYSVNQQPQLDAPSTKEDRKPLTNLVSTLVDCAPFSFRNAWHMVHAHMGGKHAEEFTLAELPVAMAFVQEQINLHTAKPAYADYPDAQLGIITELALQGARKFSLFISLGDKKTRNTSLITKGFKADIYLFEENAIEPKGVNYCVKYAR